MTVSLWQEMARYAAERYPKYIQTFRVPDLRHRTWIANYSTDGKGYGVWSIIGEDGGFRVRMVLKAKGRTYLLDHINELAPKMQETFLQRTSCTNCKNCGKHQMFQHGDHIHKLCAGAWFYSPYLEKDDLPSIQRLLDIHLAHLR